MSTVTRLRKAVVSRTTLRAIISLVVFVVLWEVGSRSRQWFGFAAPWIGNVPAPTAVAASWAHLLGDKGYWQSWYMSLARVLAEEGEEVGRLAPGCHQRHSGLLPGRGR